MNILIEENQSSLIEKFGSWSLQPQNVIQLQTRQILKCANSPFRLITPFSLFKFSYAEYWTLLCWFSATSSLPKGETVSLTNLNWNLFVCTPFLQNNKLLFCPKNICEICFWWNFWMQFIAASPFKRKCKTEGGFYQKILVSFIKNLSFWEWLVNLSSALVSCRITNSIFWQQVFLPKMSDLFSSEQLWCLCVSVTSKN